MALWSFLFGSRTADASQPDYRAYTTRFDREVDAYGINNVLGPLSSEDRATLDQAWHVLQTDLLPWRTRLHIRAADVAAEIRTRLSEEERADAAITLLIDQSGSMRGQKMIFAAASADLAQEFILGLGMTCEVLGFTTIRWRGGRSRAWWRWHLRPPRPGRLNDLLHIVYKDAKDRRASSGSDAFRQMLRPDLPKENVDGEAVLWAAGRLRRLPQRRKFLILLSDGAPVDDSTLQANGPTYLADHLQRVVEAIAAARDIRLVTIGLGPTEEARSPVSSQIAAPDDLGRALIEQLGYALVS
ncbi:cobaltochelatase CobT-related protein [Bradyrhizobium sp. SZCCHNPS2010]|uniref:cobaltochelatase CobT-related protein n=1 Tax=Bradyrhizobium sp. SZCCHNPS2010 TaxID=3057333 RepID=UPI0029164C3B|nr:cobalamin biosynthesis protein CobT [Bradyrhizobium sp. SZCCHNPS2010]